VIVRADARHLPLRDECVQCVVTSPPYWGLRKYDGEQGSEPFGLEASFKLYIEHSLEILGEIRRVLKPDGVVFWNIDDCYAGGHVNYSGSRWTHVGSPDVEAGRTLGKFDGLKPKDLCLIPERVAIAAQDEGWWIRSIIIWQKQNPMPESITDRPTRSYEQIIMLTKSARYFWDADAVREPHKQDSHRKPGMDGVRQLHNGPKGSAMNNEFRAGSNYNFRARAKGGRNIRDVWTFPVQPYKGSHFATFPEELPRRCILAATKTDDLVLDPFGGSGTTARVAIELNRRAISVDLAYHSQAEKRTRNVQRRLKGLA
jgi:DNA modification methylase